MRIAGIASWWADRSERREKEKYDHRNTTDRCQTGYRGRIGERREASRLDIQAGQGMSQHGTTPLGREAEPLSALHRLGHGREPYRRFSRLGRFPEMAQTGGPLLRFATGGRARHRDDARGLIALANYSRSRWNSMMVGTTPASV